MDDVDHTQPPWRGRSPLAVVLGGTPNVCVGADCGVQVGKRLWISQEGVGTPGPGSLRTSPHGSELTNSEGFGVLVGALTGVWAGREGLSSVATMVVAPQPLANHQRPRARVHTLVTLAWGRSLWVRRMAGHGAASGPLELQARPPGAGGPTRPAHPQLRFAGAECKHDPELDQPAPAINTPGPPGIQREPFF